MRIEAGYSAYYNHAPQQVSFPERTGVYTGTPHVTLGAPALAPGVVVDISPEAWEAYRSNKTNEAGGVKGIAEAMGLQECQTCKSRKYQDSSSDSSVSFQSPTHIDPSQAAGAVAAHEAEHVAHEQVKAERDDRKVISQTVTLQSSICPECGRVYISGGVTRTVTAKDNKAEIPEEGRDSNL
ncbi:MAG: hypothetical protein FWG99_08645 [Treponema sp.]|nr:hypothetical protein [Treponema sp.]